MFMTQESSTLKITGEMARIQDNCGQQHLCCPSPVADCRWTLFTSTSIIKTNLLTTIILISACTNLRSSGSNRDQQSHESQHSHHKNDDHLLQVKINTITDTN